MRVVEAGIEDEGYAVLSRRPLLQRIASLRPSRKCPRLQWGAILGLDLADQAEQPVLGTDVVGMEHLDALGSVEHDSIPRVHGRGVVEP